MWDYRGQRRPDFAEPPGPGQESVWDYPRPPRIVRDHRRVEVRHGEALIATTERALRVLETASSPTFYLPPEDVRWERLVEAAGTSFCEWKGRARYWALASAPERESVGWDYPSPVPAFESIGGWPSFYPSRLTCTVDGERVRPQPGGFYGGWVTADIAGPFKGEPGTGGW